MAVIIIIVVLLAIFVLFMHNSLTKEKNRLELAEVELKKYEESGTPEEIDKDAVFSFVADEPYTPMGATIRTMRVLYESMYDFDAGFFESMQKEFELDENKPLTQFSKGMKRRASILFGLSTHPKLLLLDEAYDGLEPLARLRFKQIHYLSIECLL